MARVTKRPLARVLVERGLFDSGDEARRWIMSGQIFVAGQRVDKAGAAVHVDAIIEIRGRSRYASRGGYKLAAALDHFDVDVAGRTALDCGASTGGFTDCLVQRGASLVYAVDVGHGQLLGRLRADPRVRTMERTNLADLGPATFDPLPALATLDLSYLSLTKALPLVAPLLARDADVLALMKPLFEVDDARARRTGVVQDVDLVVDALRRVVETAGMIGMRTRGVAKLALQPRHGVSEFFVYMDRAGAPACSFDDEALAAIATSPGIGPTDEPA